MYPVLFHIGGYTVFSFGLMAALALIVPGFLFAWPLLKARGFDPERVYEVIYVGGIGGFGGARIYYLFQHWSEVKGDLWGSIWSGSGFTWYGGLLGGALAIIAWCLIRKIPLEVGAMFAGPWVAAGYAIGRIGCQLSGDGDYGKPSDLPWAMAYPKGTVPTTIKVQPTPVYETIVMFALACVLYRWARRGMNGWCVFGWFLVLSGVERFLIEFIRRNPHWLLGLTAPQWESILGAIIGAVLVATFRGVTPAAAPARAGKARRR